MANEFKLSYTGAEINSKLGMVYQLSQEKADKTQIPTKVSELINDSGFITNAPVASVNGKIGSVQLTASDVGADTSGTAESLVETHNTATDSHADIRKSLNNKLNSSELSSAINNTLNSAKNYTDISLVNYYAKTEIDNFELITVDEIDAICGTTIQVANDEVKF